MKKAEQVIEKPIVNHRWQMPSLEDMVDQMLPEWRTVINPVKAAAEIATNESGEVLWVERYIFKRIHGPGETFVRDSITYTVLVSKITYGSHGGALVEHVVRAG